MFCYTAPVITSHLRSVNPTEMLKRNEVAQNAQRVHTAGSPSPCSQTTWFRAKVTGVSACWMEVSRQCWARSDPVSQHSRREAGGQMKRRPERERKGETGDGDLEVPWCRALGQRLPVWAGVGSSAGGRHGREAPSGCSSANSPPGTPELGKVSPEPSGTSEEPAELPQKGGGGPSKLSCGCFGADHTSPPQPKCCAREKSDSVWLPFPSAGAGTIFSHSPGPQVSWYTRWWPLSGGERELKSQFLGMGGSVRESREPAW